MMVAFPPFEQPPAGHRDWYLYEAVRGVPRLLLMLDRNPLSPTYGCFDREYWHYRTADFPCGMNEEFCLVLALAWATEHPQNPFFNNPRLRELAEAALRFAVKSAHGDGSCDDYFPFEKARGAAAFSLYATTESFQLLGLTDAALPEFFARRGDWLRQHQESGNLSNHQALGALALQNVFALTGAPRFRAGMEQLRDLALSWQHDEGWFQEYEGADPGYQTGTISFLAKLRQKTGDPKLTEPLQRAVDFAAHFMHPDGSYGGEYGSRNTYHFYPHGFELLARESAGALQVAELFLRKALPCRTRHFNDDNRMCAHYVYDWFQAWRDYADVPGRNQVACLSEPRTAWFAAAGLLVERDARRCAVVAAHKGGVIKLTGETGPVYSDTGPMVQLEDGAVLVAHLVNRANDVKWDTGARTLTVRGALCRRRAPVMTPARQMVFRLLALTLGRCNPNWLRVLIQKLFITGKAATDATFARTIRFGAGTIEITDEIDLHGAGRPVAVVASPDSTSIYVASSNSFQAANLLPVRRLENLLAALREKGRGSETFAVRWLSIP
ncbi:MAG: hypothetical protein ACLQAH_14605 [Limisphaerales bacterium]